MPFVSILFVQRQLRYSLTHQPCRMRYFYNVKYTVLPAIKSCITLKGNNSVDAHQTLQNVVLLQCTVHYSAYHKILFNFDRKTSSRRPPNRAEHLHIYKVKYAALPAMKLRITLTRNVSVEAHKTVQNVLLLQCQVTALPTIKACITLTGNVLGWKTLTKPRRTCYF